MAGYNKEFLIDAFLSRFILGNLAIEKIESLEVMADKFFDEVGRDKFRTYCSLDADAIKTYKNSVLCS